MASILPRTCTPPARRPLAAVLLCFALAGCGAPAASVLSPAVSGAPVVADFFGSGEGESYWVARRDDVVAAALRAGAVFDLALEKQEAGPEETRLRFADRTGETICLEIEPRSDRLTFVGFTAPAGMTRLFARQLAEELKTADAFLVDWAGGSGAFAQ